MGEAAELLKVLTGFIAAIGFGKAVALIIGAVTLKTLWTIWQDKRAEAAQREIINAKEAEIQRLATDNREYRHLFFKKLGMTEEEIAALQESRQPPKTLDASKKDAPKSKKKPAKKGKD